ncbi:hypothetical protein HHK36_015405 [Tetracentron sinense]|uniref:Uncharacterized protein n=1 Tax=Tetracentron sinense TaxID=13715 RepID=A0A835DDL7_TETSI|nr:hypothetical protein HHK36_015405 [Tetracentron sinense]
MEESLPIPMERTGKIIRRSIFTFLQNYQYFTSTVALLVFPFSASILLSQAVVPSSSPLLPIIHARLKSLFDASGLPSSSQFFYLLNLKLSQTISSSMFTIPFSLSFFLVAKAAIIQALYHHKPSLPNPSSSFICLYHPLLLTHLCNSFFILSANAAAFSLLFLAFNSLDASGFSSPNLILFLSAAGAVLYSVILANALIVSNLALVVAGMENCGGYLAILKACVLIRGRTSTALSLAIPTNLGLAAVEALFQYRVVRAYHLSGMLGPNMALEGLFIAYLYSLLIVLDTVGSCIFLKSCKSDCLTNQEGSYYYRIKLAEEEDSGLSANSKAFEELP